MREYLPVLTTRKNWNEELRNLKPDDIVAMLDGYIPRRTWRLGRVVNVKRSSDKVVRSAVVRVAVRDSRPGPGTPRSLFGLHIASAFFNQRIQRMCPRSGTGPAVFPIRLLGSDGDVAIRVIVRLRRSSSRHTP